MVEISYQKKFCEIVGIIKKLCYYLSTIKIEKKEKNEIVATTHTFIKLSHILILY